MSSEEFDFDPETCKLVSKNLITDEGTVRNRKEYCMERLPDMDFDPGQSRIVPKALNDRAFHHTSELSSKNVEEYEFDGASSRLVLKPQRRKLEKFMEHPNSSESMVFDAVTGKLAVRQISTVTTRDEDRRVMLDMNRQGPGGFFL